MTNLRIWAFTFLLSNFYISIETGAQQVIPYKNAEAKGIDLSDLSENYRSAMHIDSSRAVFASEKEEAQFGAAWMGLFKDLASYLHDQGFQWGRRTQFSCTVYFRSTGEIEYFLYGISTPGIPDSTLKSFQKHALAFAADYIFPMKAYERYSQCASFMFADQKE